MYDLRVALEKRILIFQGTLIKECLIIIFLKKTYIYFEGEKRVKYSFRATSSFTSFVFHTVPNDPLVPTAVLGEALPLHRFSLHGSHLLAWVAILSAELLFTVLEASSFKIYSHCLIKENSRG